MEKKILEYLKDWMNISSSDKSILIIVDDSLKEFQEDKNDSKSNQYFLIKTLIESHMGYGDTFDLLTKKEYRKAWFFLEQIQIKLLNIKNNLKYLDCTHEYGLKFLLNMIEFWQALYPYQVFFSSREIVNKVRCSICKETRGFFDDCEHIKSNLYMGVICYDEVIDFEVITYDVVSNPVYKFTAAYNDSNGYPFLDQVLSVITSPHQIFEVRIYEKYLRDHDGVTNSDEPCPCKRSIKLYKNCCLSKKYIYAKGIDVWFPLPLNV